jgi:hypothetical protein
MKVASNHVEQLGLDLRAPAPSCAQVKQRRHPLAFRGARES